MQRGKFSNHETLYKIKTKSYTQGCVYPFKWCGGCAHALASSNMPPMLFLGTGATRAAMPHAPEQSARSPSLGPLLGGRSARCLPVVEGVGQAFLPRAVHQAAAAFPGLCAELTTQPRTGTHPKPPGRVLRPSLSPGLGLPGGAWELRWLQPRQGSDSGSTGSRGREGSGRGGRAECEHSQGVSGARVPSSLRVGP